MSHNFTIFKSICHLSTDIHTCVWQWSCSSSHPWLLLQSLLPFPPALVYPILCVYYEIVTIFHFPFINPRRACAARVTVLGLCVCLCVCVSVTQHLTLHVIICATNDTNLLSCGWRSKILSDFLWKCFVAKLERFMLAWLHDKSAIFYSAENAHAYESGHVASGHFVLGETFFASSIIGHWQ